VILLDTNVVIHYLKGLASVVDRLQAAPRREIAVSSITVYELEYGNRNAGTAKRRAAISAFLARVPQVPFDTGAAIEAAHIRVDLESRGLVIGPMDLLIAGIAVGRGAILATGNTKEFSRVRGLRLADWMK
jgi:tRNA(fMet)-specific endonuclease VapC